MMTLVLIALLVLEVVVLSHFVELPRNYENDEEERWWWDIK
jgi:hypothetical protein